MDPGMALPHPLPTDDQLAARRQLDLARNAFRDRKRDTRRKIVTGAVVLAHAGRDPAFRSLLCLLLQEHVTRPIDRALFVDLLGG
jgi:hypothetical protein